MHSIRAKAVVRHPDYRVTAEVTLPPNAAVISFERLVNPTIPNIFAIIKLIPVSTLGDPALPRPGDLTGLHADLNREALTGLLGP